MTGSPKIHFKTVNYILYPNFSKITKSAPNFLKFTKYALIILSNLQKWPKWIQTFQNPPKHLKCPKFHLFLIY